MPTSKHNQPKAILSRILGAACVAALIASAGCGGGSSSNFALIPTYGPSVNIVNGSANSTAKAYVTTDNANVPHAIGVVVSLHALDNPAVVVPYPNATPFTVPLPPTSSLVPFRSITFFTTGGHQPGPYLVPHYHIAFSLYTTAERAGIGPQLFGENPYNPATNDPNFDLPVNPVYVPIGKFGPYIDFSSISPQELPTLGTVYFNPAVPEFQTPPQPFTTEVDYAYFAGSMSSFNLTANRDQLVAADLPGMIVQTPKPINIKVPLDLPVFYSTSGYYPTTYSITYNAASQTYTFELGDMVFHPAQAPDGSLLPQVKK